MAVNCDMRAEEMVLEGVTNFIELLDAKSDGWYEIKPNEGYTSNSSGPRIGPDTA